MVGGVHRKPRRQRSVSIKWLSQNGLEHVTDAWLNLIFTFFTLTISDNIVMWETQRSIVDWDYSNTQTFLATLKTRHRLRSGLLCFFGTRAFVSWECKKQTTVSHTESEVISLYAGLRTNGIPALDCWDLVMEVLHSRNLSVRETVVRRKPKQTHQHQQSDEETRQPR